jgi:hypothetical protein
MAATLPYLSSPGTIDTAFKKMKEAATPPRVTNDFVTAVLQLKGGTGAIIPPFLKKLGFLNTDGTPTALYDRFRNDTTSKAAVAEAMRTGYKPLFQANEYAFKLNDADLKGLILQVTGLEKDNRVAQLIQQTWKRLMAHASFEAAAILPLEPKVKKAAGQPEEEKPKTRTDSGLRLSYTINLNLPATTNPEVFAAIFRSLREHLLDG